MAREFPLRWGRCPANLAISVYFTLLYLGNCPVCPHPLNSALREVTTKSTRKERRVGPWTEELNVLAKLIRGGPIAFTHALTWKRPNHLDHWGTLKTRDWKTWDQIAGVEKTGLENTGPKRMGGIHGTGKRRTKFPGWKTHDHRLLNAKWIGLSIKLKGTLYDMYIIL